VWLGEISKRFGNISKTQAISLCSVHALVEILITWSCLDSLWLHDPVTEDSCARLFLCPIQSVLVVNQLIKDGHAQISFYPKLLLIRRYYFIISIIKFS
jgi:hypothetical protein